MVQLFEKVLVLACCNLRYLPTSSYFCITNSYFVATGNYHACLLTERVARSTCLYSAGHRAPTKVALWLVHCQLLT